MGRIARRAERGFTFVGFLMLVGVAAAVFWGMTYGPVYWDNISVKAILRQASNLSYQQHDDRLVRNFIEAQLDQQFGYDDPDGGPKKRKLHLLFEPDDLVLERTKSPPMMRIDLRYSRVVKLPIVNRERMVWFVDHAEQELSDVKW